MGSRHIFMFNIHCTMGAQKVQGIKLNGAWKVTSHHYISKK
jgi:hypothetical protein